jgi:hypothetical protein
VSSYEKMVVLASDMVSKSGWGGLYEEAEERFDAELRRLCQIEETARAWAKVRSPYCCSTDEDYDRTEEDLLVILGRYG